MARLRMPKNTVISGPSIAGVTPPPSFGAALAAARKEAEAAAAAEQAELDQEIAATRSLAQTAQVQITVDLTATDKRLQDVLRKSISGEHSAVPADRVEIAVDTVSDSAPATEHTAGKPHFIGEQGPELVSAEDLARLAQQPVEDVRSVAVPRKPSTGVEGGEQPSPGSSSSTSPRKPKKAIEPGKQPSQSRARTTGSRSKRAAAADSTADGADESATNSPTSPDEA
jgi:hypothetical protein